MTAELRDVPGWEGLYAVTADGRVWSHARAVKKNGGITSLLGRWLKPGSLTRGYLKVWLWRDSERTPARLHRLVALAWVPNPAGLPEVNHVDGNKDHNAATNLEWCTRSQNLAHAYRAGLLIMPHERRAAP